MPFFETSVQEIKYKVLKKVAELAYAGELNPENTLGLSLIHIYYMTEDRKKNGLVLIMDVRKNISLSALDRISKFDKVAEKQERRICADYIEKINIKTPSHNQTV